LDANIGNKKVARKKRKKKKRIVTENVTAAEVQGLTKYEINDAIIAARVPGKEWKATRMELDERKELEKGMEIEELYDIAGNLNSFLNYYKYYCIYCIYIYIYYYIILNIILIIINIIILIIIILLYL
jgi:hypothetical protein